MTKLDRSLKRQQAQRNKQPLWKGPSVDGITQSMLNAFIICRERFRVRYILGLQPADAFSHRLEYGQMWHLCEESLAQGADKGNKRDQWALLDAYRVELCKRYPLQQEQILHWYRVCRAQFPVYVDYWRKHKDVKARKALRQEETFAVEYNLPSDRIVLLRGKWDSVDLIGSGRRAGIWLQENKTKGDIDEQQLQNQLHFDLQTGIYLVALGKAIEHDPTSWPNARLLGVRYNVIRRPLSGGRHSIRQKKGQTTEDYYLELQGRIASEPEWFFMRWNVDVSHEDLDRYKERFLNPILEQLCDWWEYITSCRNHDPWHWPKGADCLAGYHHGIHWQTPYGIYNPISDGRGATDLDEYLRTGSTQGLERATTLFRELDNG